MNDRELLNSAAKAVGVNIRWTESGKHYTGAQPFDPLKNDGDAFRLAVELNLDVEISDCGAEVWSFDSESDIDVHVFEPSDPCKLTATRRAIVRAAAEIGARCG